MLMGVVLVGLVLVVAGCTSTGGATATPGAGTPGAASTPTAPAGEATQGQGGASQPGGGSTTNLCDLVTAAEMASAIGTAALTTKLVPGPPDSCGYLLEGGPVAALVLTPEGGDIAYGAMAADTSSVMYQGTGDKALYNPTAQTFLLMKGGKLVTIAVSVPDDKLPGPRADVLKQIATIVAGRL